MDDKCVEIFLKHEKVHIDKENNIVSDKASRPKDIGNKEEY